MSTVNPTMFKGTKGGVIVYAWTGSKRVQIKITGLDASRLLSIMLPNLDNADLLSAKNGASVLLNARAANDKTLSDLGIG